MISSKLQQQIDYLHQQIGDKEWSGPLLYSIEQGDLNNPDELVIKAHDIFLMDIGTKSGTDFEMDGESTVAMFDQYPELETGEKRTGLIHSHNSMKVYFSGTDDEELAENAQDHRIYLSLIVGFNVQPVARIAFITEIEKETNIIYKFKNLANNLLNISSNNGNTKKIVSYFDMDVNIDFNITDKFKDRYKRVVEKKEEEKKAKTKSVVPNNYGYGQHGAYPHMGQTDYQQNINKNTFSDYNIERFLCKLILGSPKSTASNLWQLFCNFDVKHLSRDDKFLELIDDCIDTTLNIKDGETPDIEVTKTLIEESMMYLEEDTISGKSYVDKFKVAKALYDELYEVLELILTTEEEENNEYARF